MKTVFNKEQLIETFLAQKQISGRTTSSLYFHGATIYSYGRHFPIMVLDVDKKVAIFNSQRYSNTTAKQQSIVRYKAIQAGFHLISIESLAHAGLTDAPSKLSETQRNIWIINRVSTNLCSIHNLTTYERSLKRKDTKVCKNLMGSINLLKQDTFLLISKYGLNVSEILDTIEKNEGNFQPNEALKAVELMRTDLQRAFATNEAVSKFM